MERFRDRDWFRRYFPRGKPFLSPSLISISTDSVLHIQYLRIKRAVQAAFNTEASYLSAKLQQIQRGQAEAQEAVNGGVDVDPMAALDRATGTAVRGFVPAASGQKVGGDGTKENEEQQQGNADEIDIEDDDDDDE